MKPILTLADYARAAAALGCEVALIRAFAEKESKGGGFLPSGLLTVRFEGHKFREFTRGKFDKTHPTLSHPYMPNCRYNTGTVGDWARLEAARKLAGDIAFDCASYGRFQIMGFHHELLGYPSAYLMVKAFDTGESAHLDGFVKFIQGMGLTGALRTKNFALLALRYNGANNSDNNYPQDLQKLYEHFRAHPA